MARASRFHRSGLRTSLVDRSGVRHGQGQAAGSVVPAQLHAVSLSTHCIAPAFTLGSYKVQLDELVFSLVQYQNFSVTACKTVFLFYLKYVRFIRPSLYSAR
ncbi:unnamed protein product [Ixodes persulcatus]